VPQLFSSIVANAFATLQGQFFNSFSPNTFHFGVDLGVSEMKCNERHQGTVQESQSAGSMTRRRLKESVANSIQTGIFVDLSSHQC
jgi:hypothetical protein